MNIFQLTCFLTVAETLNFARTAERLNITQPAVSHQIRSLEKELGVQLFIRDTHSVELTHAGHLLVPDARMIVTTSLHIHKQFETINRHELQIFGIGCNADNHLQCLPEILSDFAEIYPDVHPVIHMETAFPHLLHLLEDGKTHVVLGIKDTSSSKKAYQYEELVKSPIMCVCSVRHHLADREKITREDLHSEKLILFDPTKPSFFAATFQKEMIVEKNPNELFFCESTTTALILAKANYGVFFFPEISRPKDNDLAAIPIEDVDYESFGIYYSPGKNNVLVKDFISITRKRMKNSLF